VLPTFVTVSAPIERQGERGKKQKEILISGTEKKSDDKQNFVFF